MFLREIEFQCRVHPSEKSHGNLRQIKSLYAERCPHITPFKTGKKQSNLRSHKFGERLPREWKLYSVINDDINQESSKNKRLSLAGTILYRGRYQIVIYPPYPLSWISQNRLSTV